MAGTLGSFFAGFLISITFSLPVAIIVGIVWKDKTRAYWIGVFFGLIILVFLLIVFGLLKIIFGDEYISLTLQSSKVCPCYVGK